mmetsp:Transcript_1274/g.1523  ORF Transcript_1274/g.1523 Transcript_1274/m.1523 type:complete len:165 (-) Transcript_1274:455-949(-)
MLKGKTHEVKEALWHPRKFWLLGRCVFGAIAYVGMAFSLRRLPLSFTSILVNTTPFWATIVAYFVIGDRITFADLVCMTGALFGISILAFDKETNDGSSAHAGKSISSMDGSQILIGLCWGLICATTFAFVVVFTRKIKEMFPSMILFYYALVSLMIYTPFMVY